MHTFRTCSALACSYYVRIQTKKHKKGENSKKERQKKCGAIGKLEEIPRASLATNIIFEILLVFSVFFQSFSEISCHQPGHEHKKVLAALACGREKQKKMRCATA